MKPATQPAAGHIEKLKRRTDALAGKIDLVTRLLQGATTRENKCVVTSQMTAGSHGRASPPTEGGPARRSS